MYKRQDHTDYYQDQTSGNSGANVDNYSAGRYEGIVIYSKNYPGYRSYQGLFVGGNGSRERTHWKDCISVVTNGSIKIKSSATTLTSWSNSSVEYCTGLAPYPSPVYDPNADGQLILGGIIHTPNYNPGTKPPGTKNHCIESDFNGTTEDSTVGTNLVIGIGSKVEPHMERQNEYYVGPINKQYTAGKSPLTELKPKVGTIAHWDTAGFKGWARRAKEIYVDGIHPGHSKNKILANYWNAKWNFDNAAAP